MTGLKKPSFLPMVRGYRVKNRIPGGGTYHHFVGHNVSGKLD